MSKSIPDFRLSIVLILISFLIFWLDSIHFLSFLQKGASFITNPISFGLYQTNKEIRKELNETKSVISQSMFLDPSTYNLVPARPIGLKRYLKIDKGSESGLELGLAVVFNDNYLGKIVNLSERSANIQLLSDPDSKVAAFSQGLESRGKGVLIGQFGSEMLLDKILHEEKINIGDLVYSEGTEGFLPRGLILGKVTEVLNRENEVFKQAKVAPNFDIRDLELVFVILED